ncbi:ATP-binding protein [Halorarius litoreus]|uniref:Dph6-related ATP pyrophosphatase n=1 Tax=Halorarius litoreus TaxID=2962676 RepID=UPI0020CEC7A3|nr:ATP-binding protein [Halorarius litoreus]
MAVVCSWSGGKDSALALWALERQGVEVVELLTTTHGNRSRSHRVRTGLLERQAEALGYPIRFVDVPHDAANDVYESRLRAVADSYAGRADALVFADLHLDDIREYRERLYADTALDPRFPLWGRDPETLFETFTERFEGVVVCTNDALGPAFAGRRLDADFRTDLPDDADPCGENGEFHTFVTDGPPFDAPVPVTVGEAFTETSHGMRLHYRDLSLE